MLSVVVLIIFSYISKYSWVSVCSILLMHLKLYLALKEDSHWLEYGGRSIAYNLGVGAGINVDVS